jgi:uncharacterized protein (DUF486 family)
VTTYTKYSQYILRGNAPATLDVYSVIQYSMKNAYQVKPIVTVILMMVMCPFMVYYLRNVPNISENKKIFVGRLLSNDG